jgi:hypothetical protein
MVGTELFLMPGTAVVDGPVLRRGDDFQILAANNVKLIAQKLILSQRDDPAVTTQAASSHTATPSEVLYDSGDEEGMTIPTTTTGQRQHQVRFLKHLERLKKSRGETDKVPFHDSRAINATKNIRKLWQRRQNDGFKGREQTAAADVSRAAAGTARLLDGTAEAAESPSEDVGLEGEVAGGANDKEREFDSPTGPDDPDSNSSHDSSTTDDEDDDGGSLENAEVEDKPSDAGGRPRKRRKLSNHS